MQIDKKVPKPERASTLARIKALQVGQEMAVTDSMEGGESAEVTFDKAYARSVKMASNIRSSIFEARKKVGGEYSVKSMPQVINGQAVAAITIKRIS